MKRLTWTIAATLAALLGLTACTQETSLTNVDSLDGMHKVEYTVGLTSATATLKEDADWNRLLTRLVDRATEGTEVTFRGTYGKGQPPAAKAADTCRTTSRKEIKEWCSKMEREGKTVTLTYDRATGTYTGTAYAARPRKPVLDTTLIVGQWDLLEKTVTLEFADGTAPNTNTITPDAPLIDIRRWVFTSDGKVLATLNKNPNEGAPNEWETHTLDWKVYAREGVTADGMFSYRCYILRITGKVNGEGYEKAWTLTECTGGTLVVEQNSSAEAFGDNLLHGTDENTRTLWHFARRKASDKLITKDGKENVIISQKP